MADTAAMRTWFASLALSVALAGCYLVPPIRAGAAAGGQAGQIAARDGRAESSGLDSAPVTELHVAVTPQTLTRGASRRRSDVSLGWLFDFSQAADGRKLFDHGPYVEGAWFVKGASPVTEARWRLGPTLRGEVLIPEDGRRDLAGEKDTAGFGASAGILLEYVEEFHGGGVAPGAYGGYQGELGLGLALRGGVRAMDGTTVGFAMLAVEFRWPGMIGVAIPLTPSRR